MVHRLLCPIVLLLAGTMPTAKAMQQACLPSSVSIDGPFKTGSPGLTELSANCIVVGPEPRPLSSWAFRSAPGAIFTWDLAFYSNVYTLPAKGATISVTRLHLVEVLLDLQHFLYLRLFAFEGTGSTLDLSALVIETDCYTIYVYQTQLLPTLQRAEFTSGVGYIYVSSYQDAQVIANDVNITCVLPRPLGQLSSSSVTLGHVVPTLLADTTLELVSALGYLQQYGHENGTGTVLLTSNLSLVAGPWPTAGLLLSRNATVAGQVPGTVLDLQGRTGLFVLQPGVVFTFAQLTLMNLNQERGTGIPGRIITLFSYPVWAVHFDRTNVTNLQLHFQNVRMVVSKDEFDYLTLWAVFATASVSSAAVESQMLTEHVLALEPESIKGPAGQDPTILAFRRLAESGFDGYNLSITAMPPATFPVIVNDTIMPSFYSTLRYPSITAIPVYTYAELFKALSLAANNPAFRPFPTAVLLYANISLDTRAWPARGFDVSSDVSLIGMPTTPTTLDLRSVPCLVNLAPGNRLHLQHLALVNLANTTRAGYSVAPQNVGMDNTLQFPFVRMSREPGSYQLNFTKVSVVIPYAEYKDLRSTEVGSSPAINYISPLQLSVAAETNVGWLHYSSLSGAGWLGSDVNITYYHPTAVLQYVNAFDSPPAAPAVEEARSPPEPDNLQAWEIGVIASSAMVSVIAAGILVVLVMRWRHRGKRHRLAKSKGIEDLASNSGNAELESGGAGNISQADVMGAGTSSRTQTSSSAIQSSANSVAAGSREALSGTSHGSPPLAAGSAAAAAALPQAPLTELHAVMHTLAQEIDDEHLVILEVVGQGGFGTVYKALWKGLMVAVKTITFQDRMRGGEKAQHRAIMEAAISSSLAHPNVVITYSYDIKPLLVQRPVPGDGGLVITESQVSDWKLYIIQEYCDAGSLRAAVLRRKFWNESRKEPVLERVLETAIELARGLIHLHGKNIVHGDLNPNNVLLKREHGAKYGVTCKLCDFGLSVKMAAGQSHISNMHRGTPFYTGPEVLQAGNFTKAADVFSFGVMLWELYHSTMSYKTHPQHGWVQREDYPSFPARCPVEFVALATSCISPDPLLRPPMADVLSHLQRMLQRWLHTGQLQTVEQAAASAAASAAAVQRAEARQQHFINEMRSVTASTHNQLIPVAQTPRPQGPALAGAGALAVGRHEGAAAAERSARLAPMPSSPPAAGPVVAAAASAATGVCPSPGASSALSRWPRGPVGVPLGDPCLGPPPLCLAAAWDRDTHNNSASAAAAAARAAACSWLPPPLPIVPLPRAAAASHVPLFPLQQGPMPQAPQQALIPEESSSELSVPSSSSEHAHAAAAAAMALAVVASVTNGEPTRLGRSRLLHAQQQPPADSPTCLQQHMGRAGLGWGRL